MPRVGRKGRAAQLRQDAGYLSRRLGGGTLVLAPADEGETWRKLLDDEPGESKLSAFNAESRGLSADGWVYCVTDSGKA